MIRLEGALINHSTAKIKALVWKLSVDNQYFGNNTPAYLCSFLSTDWNKYSYIWILPRTWLCFKTPKLSLKWEDLTSSQLIFIPAPSFHIVETVFFFFQWSGSGRWDASLGETPRFRPAFSSHCLHYKYFFGLPTYQVRARLPHPKPCACPLALAWSFSYLFVPGLL